MFRSVEFKTENGAFTHIALNLRLTVVPFQNMFHDGQPKAGSSSFTATTFIHAIKAGTLLQMIAFTGTRAIVQGADILFSGTSPRRRGLKKMVMVWVLAPPILIVMGGRTSM